MALWHTPSFLLSGTKQSAWDFWPFFFGIVAISVILTAMFNAARGSLLVAFLCPRAGTNNPAIWESGRQPCGHVAARREAVVVVAPW